MATNQYGNIYARMSEEAEIGKQRMARDAELARQAESASRQSSSQYATSEETAKRYPWIETEERVSRERIKQGLQDYYQRAIEVSQYQDLGMDRSEAEALVRQKNDLMKKAQLQAARNAIINKTSELAQMAKETEMKNTIQQANIEFLAIDPSKEDAVPKMMEIKKRIAPYANFKEASDFEKGIEASFKIASDFEKQRRAENTQERLTRAEEQKAFYESPEQVEKRAIIAATAAEQAKEKFAKFQAETPEAKQKEQQRMASLKRQGLSAINQIDQQIKAELSTFAGPGKISLPQLEMAKPVDEKGRPVKSMDEATNFLVTTYVGNKEKKTVVPRASVIGAIQTIRGLEQQKQAARDELRAYGISESNEEPTAPTEAPAGMTQPQTTEVETTSVSVAPTTQYSADNPYAAQATSLETQQQKARTEAERKALRLQLAPKIQDAQARIARAQEVMKNPTVLLPQSESVDGVPTILNITDQDRAKAFETAKKELADAQAEYSALLEKYPVTSTENDATTSAAPSATKVPLGAIF